MIGRLLLSVGVGRVGAATTYHSQNHNDCTPTSVFVCGAGARELLECDEKTTARQRAVRIEF